MSVVPLLALVFACFSPSEEAASPLVGPPREVVASEAPAAPSSAVTVPITIAASLLQAQIDAQVPPVLVDSTDEQLDPGVVGDVLAERDGPISVHTDEGELRLDVPVSLHVRPRPGFARGTKGAIGTVTAAMVVQVHLRPTLAEDWTLDAHARVDHRWVDSPILKIGPLKIDIEPKVNKKLAIRFEQVAADIDADLKADPKLREDIQRTWDSFAAPQALRADPPTWLVFTPSRLYASDPEPSAAGLQVVAGAAGRLEVVLGDAPRRRSLGPLPPLGRPGKAGAQVTVPIRLTWGPLIDAARAQLAGRTETIDLPGGASATLHDLRLVDLYPSGSRIAVGVELGLTTDLGELDIRAWLLGTPSLVGTDLHIVDFDYTASTDNRWLDAAHDAVADRVRDAVAEGLVFPLAPELEKARGDVNAMLAAGKPPAGVPEGVRLSGRLDTLTVTDVRVTEPALVITGALGGRVAVAVDR